MPKVGEKLTPEVREKMAEALARKSTIRQNRLTVGGWNIYRIDSLNIVLQKGNDGDPCYYPDVPSALKSLLRRMTDPTTKQSLAEHVKLIDKAETAIVDAIGRAGGLGTLFEGVEA